MEPKETPTIKGWKEKGLKKRDSERKPRKVKESQGESEPRSQGRVCLETTASRSAKTSN